MKGRLERVAASEEAKEKLREEGRRDANVFVGEGGRGRKNLGSPDGNISELSEGVSRRRLRRSSSPRRSPGSSKFW